MIADDGRIVVQTTNSSTTTIILYDYDLGKNQIIAATGTDWLALGRSPGVSDDGSMVAFYGNLSPNAPDAQRLGPGPGIFASLKIKDPAGNERWQLQPVASQSTTGPLTGFSPYSRVAVNYVRSVAYIAYDDANQQNAGLYVSRLNWFSIDGNNPPNTFKVAGPPSLVVKVGMAISDAKGLLGEVADLDVFDPLNDHNRGDLVFWMKTKDGTEAIVSATPLCPGSNYADPSTNSYVSQYAAGRQYGWPMAFDTPGGNSCGPTALLMLTNALYSANGGTEHLPVVAPLFMSDYDWTVSKPAVGAGGPG